jgi:hypothetical protein
LGKSYVGTEKPLPTLVEGLASVLWQTCILHPFKANKKQPNARIIIFEDMLSLQLGELQFY